LLHLSARDLLLQRTGLWIASERAQHFTYCLRAACRDLGCDDADHFLSLLRTSPLDRPAWQRILHHLTIGETYFFRDVEILRETLQRLIAEKRTNPKNGFTLRIWSAGCATGEEPYTIAMLLHDLLPDISRWQIIILGTDINQQALNIARRGRYGEWSMRGTIPTSAQTFLVQQGRAWHVTESIRQMVEFRLTNLIDPAASGLTNADLVVCRNVLYYLAPQYRAVALTNLKAALAPNGELLLGREDVSYQPRRKPMNQWDAEIHTPSLGFDPVNSSPEVSVDDEIAQARHAANSAQWDDAIRWLDQAESKAPVDLAVQFLRALVYEGLGDVDQAMTTLQRCLYLDHNFALGYFMLGNLSAREGKPTQAQRYWNNAVVLLRELPPDQLLPLSDGLTVQNVLALVRTRLGEPIR
jgi:chemotaxis protein methyltransferase CheR